MKETFLPHEKEKELLAQYGLAVAWINSVESRLASTLQHFLKQNGLSNKDTKKLISDLNNLNEERKWLHHGTVSQMGQIFVGKPPIFLKI